MLTLVPGEMGGSESYARGLCGALAANSSIDAVAFVTRAARDAGEGLPTEVVAGYPSGRSALGKVFGMTVGLARRGKMRRAFSGVDVVHYPFTVPVPPLTVPTAVTLHDVQHLDLPELFTWQTRSFRRVAYDRAARRAGVVIVASTFVRDRAQALLDLDPARVEVVPHGIDHSVFSPSAVAREDFVLYPARVWPHKNHARLLAAFELLRRARPELSLVLTGAGTEAFAGSAGVIGRGVVRRAELVDLYRRASCVVFPSLYEGFGAPPLEAMACGTPVAASNAGSLPEVCGEAAVLFDPSDPEAIAAGVAEAIERSATLAGLGVVRAAEFTWIAAAEGHIRAYRLAGRSQR
jgi:glycosyltransferase involved in cell wall biosynthesis